MEKVVFSIDSSIRLSSSMTDSTSSSIFELPAGDYTVTVIDSNGCTAISSSHVISDAGAPTMIISQDTSICEGDSALISAAASNGIQPSSPLSTFNSFTEFFFFEGHWQRWACYIMRGLARRCYVNTFDIIQSIFMCSV